MSDGRRKEITYHIPERELDEKLAEADDGDVVRRLSFVKNLYRGDTIAEAADRVGRSEATGDRWADAWNEGGLDALAPSHGGGRPPKLDERERRRLTEMLREDQPWKSREVRRLIEDEFGVEYHPDYLSTFLRKLGFTYSGRRPESHSDVGRGTPADADDEREAADGGGWILDDVRTDGGTGPGMVDVTRPLRDDTSWRPRDGATHRPGRRR